MRIAQLGGLRHRVALPGSERAPHVAPERRRDLRRQQGDHRGYVQRVNTAPICCDRCEDYRTLWFVERWIDWASGCTF
jgi:hypothetical protein